MSGSGNLNREGMGEAVVNQRRLLAPTVGAFDTLCGVRLRLRPVLGVSVAIGMLVTSNGVLALDPHREFTQYTRTVWTQAQGLPSDSIRAITQTTDGYLWLGTEEGLARFDGYSFVNFSKADGALPNNTVNALLPGDRGSLWIGTSGGLAKYADGRFKIFTKQDGFPGSGVGSLAADRDGSLWFASGGLLYRFKDNRFTAWPRKSLAPLASAEVVYEDPQHQIWVSGIGGLLKRAAGRFIPVLGPKELGDAYFTELRSTPYGLWMGGTKGVIQLGTDGRLVHYTTRNGLPHNLVKSVYADRNGNVWVGTVGGLSRLQNAHFISPSTNNRDVITERVWSLFEDREGDLWVGLNSALMRLRDDRFLTYGRPEGLPSDEPIVVHQNGSGLVWVGYHDGGLVSFVPGDFPAGGFRVYTTADGLPSNEVFSIRDAQNGDLLVGTGNGLVRMHAGRFTNYSIPDGLGHRAVYDVLEDHSGEMWAATAAGVYKRRGNVWIPVFQGGGSSSEITVALAEDRKGNIWAGMFGAGLWLLKGPALAGRGPRRFSVSDGLSSNQIRSLYVDSDNALWIGTSGGGLSEYRDGIFHRYGARDGLLSDNVVHVEDDLNGNLWLSTPRGICEVPRHQLREFAEGKLRLLKPTNFGVEDGLRSAQCAPGFPPGGGGTRTSDGRLWFPTSQGLSSIDPSSPAHAPDSSDPVAQILDVAVNGTPMNLSLAAKLKPGSDWVQFRYSGIYLRAPERVRYETMLDGLDQGWKPAANHRVATFNPLPHGRYVFKVRAMLPEGNTSEADLAFEVQPHFYQTLWFSLLTAACFLGAIYAIHLVHLRQIHGRFALVLDERTRLAREIHDTLAQNLIGIASQLDVLAGKLKGDPAVVRSHLDLARKMARHSITEARRSVMDLRARELDAQDLSSALATLAQRWVAGGSVRIEVHAAPIPRKLSDDLEKHLLRIAQESVTNALKHAGAEMIRVSLECQGSILRMWVKDDGMGFDPSKTFSLAGGHFGILGMRERAERIGAQFRLESGPGSGTTIEVTVPLE